MLFHLDWDGSWQTPDPVDKASEEPYRTPAEKAASHYRQGQHVKVVDLVPGHISLMGQKEGPLMVRMSCRDACLFILDRLDFIDLHDVLKLICALLSGRPPIHPSPHLP